MEWRLVFKRRGGYRNEKNKSDDETANIHSGGDHIGFDVSCHCNQDKGVRGRNGGSIQLQQCHRTGTCG